MIGSLLVLQIAQVSVCKCRGKELLHSFAGTNSVALPALPLFNIVVSKKLEKNNVEKERKRPQMQEETRKNPAASPLGGVEDLVTVGEPSPERGEGKRKGPLQICF